MVVAGCIVMGRKGKHALVTKSLRLGIDTRVDVKCRPLGKERLTVQCTWSIFLTVNAVKDRLTKPRGDERLVHRRVHFLRYPTSAHILHSWWNPDSQGYLA